jgi:hypothetical protein
MLPEAALPSRQAREMAAFKTGQSLMIRSSWAEFNEREAASVAF